MRVGPGMESPVISVRMLCNSWQQLHPWLLYLLLKAAVTNDHNEMP